MIQLGRGRRPFNRPYSHPLNIGVGWGIMHSWGALLAKLGAEDPKGGKNEESEEGNTHVGMQLFTCNPTMHFSTL